MKSTKIILILIIVLTVLGFATVSALAQEAEEGAPQTLDLSGKLTNVGESAGLATPGQEPRIASIIGGIVRGLLSLLGIIFMGYIIYAGQLWMTARGNEEQIVKAKAIIRGSIIGIIIVLSAYAITWFVSIYAITESGFSGLPTNP